MLEGLAEDSKPIRNLFKTFPPKNFLQNKQAHPLGMDCSAQFVNAALQIVSTESRRLSSDSHRRLAKECKTEKMFRINPDSNRDGLNFWRRPERVEGFLSRERWKCVYFCIIFSSMKKILLIGKQLTSVPPLDQLSIKDVLYFAAPDLKTVRQVFEKNNNAIDIVIAGAGIELWKRLEIVKYVFDTSNTTSVHMKDWETGPGGFIPFINKVLSGLLTDKQ